MKAERILIIKPSSLGDVVHSLPTLVAIRRRFPKATIAWLIKKHWAPLLHGHPFLDEVIEVEFSPWAWWRIGRALRDRRFDLVIDLQGLFRSGLMAWLSRGAVRIGFDDAREGSRVFYSERVSAPMRGMHAVDRYLHLAAAVGCHPDVPEFVFPSRPNEQEKTRELFSSVGVHHPQKAIGMLPSARWITKRWAPERFAALADRLQSVDGYRVVLLGGIREQRDTERITRAMRTDAADLTGRTTVADLPGVMRALRLVISNDSGPMHIAAAVGTPVVALFGPTHPICTGPYGEGHAVLTAPVDCRPCFRRTCKNPNQYACLEQISVDQAFHAAHRILIEQQGGEYADR